MSVTVKFACDGCLIEADGTSRLEVVRTYTPVGTWGGVEMARQVTERNPKLETVTPEGWVAFDPYTLMTYCPECWEKIISDDEETQEPTQ